MNNATLDLKQIPWLQRRSTLRELKQRFPKFGAFCLQVQLLRLSLTALAAFVFYTFRDHLGVGMILGIIAAGSLIEWWLERVLVLPVANLHLAAGSAEPSAETRSEHPYGSQW